MRRYVRSGEGSGLGTWILEFLQTPVTVILASAAVTAVVVNGLVGIAEDHKSSELICVEAGGDWTKDLYNGEQKCDMSKVEGQ